MFTALYDLVLPSRCAGCPAPGAALCPACAAALVAPFRHAPTPPPPGLPAVWAAGRYAGAVRAALLAYKERGRRDLAAVLGGALARAVRECGRERAGPPARAGGGRAAGAVRLALVPVPSRAVAARRRGGDHVRRLADRAVAVLQGAGVDARVLPVLRLARARRDSAGLDAAGRARNVAGGFVAIISGETDRTWQVVLVDDLVTTGSTLADAARALRVAGLAPVAAATVAATFRRGRASRPGDRAGNVSTVNDVPNRGCR
jgi:predicted amidophosphoribosyltransferase